MTNPPLPTTTNLIHKHCCSVHGSLARVVHYCIGCDSRIPFTVHGCECAQPRCSVLHGCELCIKVLLGLILKKLAYFDCSLCLLSSATPSLMSPSV